MLIKDDDEILNDIFRELNECSFQNWYRNFEKISIPSICLKIPENIVKYLDDEIIVLPKECYKNETSPNFIEISGIQQDEVDDSSATTQGADGGGSGGEAASSGSDNDIESPEFPEFSQLIKETIEKLGGSAFIKLNWHCPEDAYWITAGQTLKVKDITDVYQLLKASGFIKTDLCYYDLPRKNDTNVEHYLVIKEWREIHPGTEFRCFVKNRNLIAISPRDWPQYHKHILTQNKDIVSDIVSIFREKIKHQFPLENFVFDVIRETKDVVRLIDFSPLRKKYTEPLAFDWEFLEDPDILQDSDEPEFRYLSADYGIIPNRRNNYGVPQDIIDMLSGNSGNSSLSNLADLLSSHIQEILTIEDGD